VTSPDDVIVARAVDNARDGVRGDGLGSTSSADDHCGSGVRRLAASGDAVLWSSRVRRGLFPVATLSAARGVVRGARQAGVVRQLRVVSATEATRGDRDERAECDVDEQR